MNSLLFSRRVVFFDRGQKISIEPLVKNRREDRKYSFSMFFAGTSFLAGDKNLLLRVHILNRQEPAPLPHRQTGKVQEQRLTSICIADIGER
jgi:hypothetical protein